MVSPVIEPLLVPVPTCPRLAPWLAPRSDLPGPVVILVVGPGVGPRVALPVVILVVGPGVGPGVVPVPVMIRDETRGPTRVTCDRTRLPRDRSYARGPVFVWSSPCSAP